jgi:uncharacterized protein YraI
MRVRNWVLIAVAALALGAAGCTARVAQTSRNTPVPTKTLRPTFTATVPKPTLTPTPTAAESGAAAQSAENQAAAPTVEPPTPTTEPTAEPSPTPEPAAFTVTSASINVRGGPGTGFPVIGRLTNGQSYPITGKNADGSWWQFDYNGQTGWVIGANVSVTSSDAVQVAQNIPQPPTAAPRPTARPAAPRPTQAPQPQQPAAQPAPASAKYAVSGTGRRPDTNDWVTVYCLLFNQSGSSLLPGTLRLLRDGQVVGTAQFTQFATYYLDSGYNAGCKVEVRPAVDGAYTAVLVEGDQVVSDPITFTVSGPDTRINFVAWKQK